MEANPTSIIVVMILLLLGVLIIGYIFGDKTGGFVEQVSQWFEESSGETCASAVMRRYCECPNGYVCDTLPPPPDGWADGCSRCYQVTGEE